MTSGQPTCGSLFSGIGLLDIGLHLAGWDHAWLCESDPWRRGMLRKRFPDAVVYDDVRTLRGEAAADASQSGREARASNRVRAESGPIIGCVARPACAVDLITGGFPCKGASTAGKREGFEHSETVLWHEMRRLTGDLHPRYVLIENVASILSIGGQRINDRCVCGWPYRRGGMSLHLGSEVREAGRGDGGSSEAAARGAVHEVRRKRVNDAPRDGQVADGVLLDDLDGAGTTTASDGAALDAQTRAGDALPAGGADSPELDPARQGERAVDGRSAPRSRRPTCKVSALEPQGAENGACPSCGRAMDQTSKLPPGSLWGTVLADLAALGFDVVWDCIPAAAVGAPHLRDRVFAVATQPARADAEQNAGQRRQQDGRTDAAGSGHRAPADTYGGRLATSTQLNSSANEDPANRDPRRQHPHGRVDSARAGVAVEWGEYQPAITRWETIHGPAPEPLIRRLDDGDAKLQRVRARMDRSRLSALGDGVHVYVGMLAGQHIMNLEQERLAALDMAA